MDERLQGVTFFSTELPNCDQYGVVKPTGRAVRTECSLPPPHKTDDALKSPSLKAFSDNGHPSPIISHHK
jgi:hypothetical protein